MNKKYNEIIIEGDVAKIICYCKGERYEVLIDAEDVDKVKDYRWCLAKGFPITNIRVNNKKTTIKLNRFLLDCDDYDTKVMYENENKLDNRKCNLKFMSQGEVNKFYVKGSKNAYITPSEVICEKDYAKIICYHKGEKSAEALIDLEDVDKVKGYKWVVNKGYVGNKQLGCLHRYLMHCPDDMVVDHINHDTLDNRKSNLRICSHDDNMKNKKVYKVNKSGVPGVWKDESRGGKYRVTVSGKYIGSFESFEEAVKVRERVAKEEFGEYYNEEG